MRAAVEYHEKIDILNIVFADHARKRTVSRCDDAIQVDLDADGRVIAIEVIGAKSVPFWEVQRVFQEFGITYLPEVAPHSA